MEVYALIYTALLLTGLLLWSRQYFLSDPQGQKGYRPALTILVVSFAFVGFKMMLDYGLLKEPSTVSSVSPSGSTFQSADEQFNIGRAFYTGKGLPKDDGQALFWLTLAAQNGSAQAKELLSLLGYSVEGSRSTANTTEEKKDSVASATFAVEIIPAKKIKTTLKDVAGLSQTKGDIQSFIDAIHNAKNYTKLGARPPKGIILYGPPGTGKTLIARAIAGEANATFLATSGSAFEESYVGVGASRIRELFNLAKRYRPAIIFIDEIDAVAGSRQTSEVSATQIQTLNQLLAEMDNIDAEKAADIYVIAATNRLEALDNAILRPGRFDWQIQIPLPNEADRREILDLYLKKIVANKAIQIDELVLKTAGYSGADLRNLVNEAAFIAAREKKQSVDMADFEAAFKKVSSYEKALSPELSVKILPPSEIKTTFADIAGMNEAKNEVAEVVQFLADPQKFTRLGAKPPGGIIIYGPPGTGKTLMARAMAGEAKVNFLAVSGSAFDEKYVGVGAARVRELFKLARKYKPCIVFIDEMDALAPKRQGETISGKDQTINQFLNEMDNIQKGVNEGIIFIGATNRLDIIDEAVLRPGRFDRKVYFRLPNILEREEIIALAIKKVKVSKDVNIKLLAQTTTGFSGADLTNMVNEATIEATRHNKKEVDMAAFEEAIDKITLGVRQDVVYSDQERKLTAYHEAGHALVGLLSPDHPQILYKITIGLRGQTLGVTHFRVDAEKYSITKKQYEALIATALGGYVAEEIIFGKDNITSGSASDLLHANQLAKDMVTKFGMGDDQSLIVDSVLKQSDQEVNKNANELLKRNYAAAKQIIEKNRDKLDIIANALLKDEILSFQQLKTMLKLKERE